MFITTPLRNGSDLIDLTQRRWPLLISQSNPYISGHQARTFSIERTAITLSLAKGNPPIALRHYSSRTALRRGRDSHQQRATVPLIDQLTGIWIKLRHSRVQPTPTRQRITTEKRDGPSIRGDQHIACRIIRAVQGRHTILKTPVLNQFGIESAIHAMIDLLQGQAVKVWIHSHLLPIFMHGNRRAHRQLRLTTNPHAE